MRVSLFRLRKKFYVSTFKDFETFRIDFFSLYKQKVSKSYIFDIHETENTIEFSAPVARFAWNGWNVFNPVSQGKVQITEAGKRIKIEYEYYFSEFFVISVLMSFLSAVAAVMNLVPLALGIFIFVWLVFFGLSRSIASFRLNSLIAGFVQSVNNPEVLKRDFDRYLKEEWKFIDRVFFTKNYKDAVG